MSASTHALWLLVLFGVLRPGYRWLRNKADQNNGLDRLLGGASVVGVVVLIGLAGFFIIAKATTGQ
jgi:hypothetical protein